MNSWKTFSASSWLWKHFPSKTCQDAWEVVVSWWEVRWIWSMRQNFVAQFVQFLKCWLCNMLLGIVAENWALSVDQCRLQALQLLVHLIDLLSILLRCNGFIGALKGAVDQQQTTKQWTWPLFGANLALGSVLELLLGPVIKLVIDDCHVQSTFCCTSQSN